MVEIHRQIDAGRGPFELFAPAIATLAKVSRMSRAAANPNVLKPTDSIATLAREHEQIRPGEFATIFLLDRPEKPSFS
jgi:hypothetical protein